MTQAALSEYPSGATAIDFAKGGTNLFTGDASGVIIQPSELVGGNPLPIEHQTADVGDLDADSVAVPVQIYRAHRDCVIDRLIAYPSALAVAAGETIDLELHILDPLESVADIAAGNILGLKTSIDENATAPIVFALDGIPEKDRVLTEGQTLWLTIDGFHDAQSGPNTLGFIGFTGYARDTRYG